MAQKRLKSMIFPGLSDTYTVPQALSDLTDYSDFTDAQQDITDLQTGLTAAEESVTTYVVGNTNTTGVQLDPGTYVWVKNHSVLTDGLYTVGSTAIVQGGSVVDTNMNAVSEGGLNSLKNTFPTHVRREDFTTPTPAVMTSETVIIEQFGKIIMAQISCGLSTLTAGTVLLTLPSDLKPIYTQFFPVFKTYDGHGVVGEFRVDASTGYIMINNNQGMTVSSHLRCNMFWFI